MERTCSIVTNVHLLDILSYVQSGDTVLMSRFTDTAYISRPIDKVETIGDAYMVASGLPTVYERHAHEMSLLALELLDSVKHHVIPHMPQQKLQLRIGLHSGLLPLNFTK